MSQVVADGSRQIRHEAQRLEILGAAAAAIAEHGFHGMTMRGLARATGKGLASFYNYFSSKEDVLFALQSEAFETMTHSAHEALAGVAEPVDRLYVFILNHLRYLAKHTAEMRVLVTEASALPAGRRKTVRLLKEAYFKTCRDIVAAILADGLDPAEVERVTYSVFGMLNWSYGWYDPRRHGSPEDVARTIHAVAVCGLACPHGFEQLDAPQRAAVVPTRFGGSERNGTAPANRLAPAEKNVKRVDARKTYGQETA